MLQRFIALIGDVSASINRGHQDYLKMQELLSITGAVHHGTLTHDQQDWRHVMTLCAASYFLCGQQNPSFQCLQRLQGNGGMSEDFTWQQLIAWAIRDVFPDDPRYSVVIPHSQLGMAYNHLIDMIVTQQNPELALQHVLATAYNVGTPRELLLTDTFTAIMRTALARRAPQAGWGHYRYA